MSLALYHAQRMARRLIADGISEQEAVGAAAFLHHVPVAVVQRYVGLALAACEHARRDQAEAAERTAELHGRRERGLEAAS